MYIFMKFYNLSFRHYAFGVLVVMAIIGLYEMRASETLVWSVFGPLKVVALIGEKMLLFPQDQNSLFSLLIGAPLTVMYWIAILGLPKNRSISR